MANLVFPHHAKNNIYHTRSTHAAGIRSGKMLRLQADERPLELDGHGHRDVYIQELRQTLCQETASRK